jgi:hypothetical protein
LRLFYKIPFTVLCSLLFVFTNGQVVITGTVYDSTRTVPVKDVTIQSSNGTMAVTDSNGRYNIVAGEMDSLIFIYQNKPTLKFAVAQVPNSGIFDIALHIRVDEKYKRLKEVKVYARSYRQDSAENRERYAKAFNYQKPGIRLNTSSYSGAAGVDLDELINIFRFKRNKQLRKMRQRLEEEEKEKFVDYRFNKAAVRRVTRLDGKELEVFMKQYRPGFEFTLNSEVVDFYQYILNASYEFKVSREKEAFIDTRFNKALVQMATGLADNNLELFMKRFRPGYEFTKSSSAAEFHEYIMAAYSQFRTGLQQQVIKPDSLNRKSLPDTLLSN